MPSIEKIKQTSPQILLKLIQRAKDYLKKDPTLQEMCDKYNFDIDDIDLIPVKFGDIDVSATTNQGVITLNWRLLEDGDFFNDLHYLVHEFQHYLGQSNAPTQSADDGDYLANPDEQKGFQAQIKYIADHDGENEAKKYTEQVLDHHDETGKERTKKEKILMKLVNN